MNKSLILATLLAMMVALAEAQTRQARQRNNSARPKSKKDMCHGKEVDKCYEQLKAYSKGEYPGEILKTKEGIDKLCGSFDAVVECQKNYIKKCATPLQRELFDFFLESFTKTVEEFCKNPESKQKLLTHSPCIVDKVLETPDYRSQCVDRLLAAVDYLNSTSRVTQDDKYDTACCGFTTWQKCTKDRVSAACGKDAVDIFQQYLLDTFGGFNGQICPDDVFGLQSDTCKKALPPTSFKSKGRLSDNPLTQYISIYAGFLFGSNSN